MNKKQKSIKMLLGSIGVELSKLREEKGFDTIKNFAKKNKLPEVQYWRIEKGKANLTLKSLEKILAIHKISFEDFFCHLTMQ
jgi:transcriptional regulator with XRE-family HTH domain